jgi:hypothetical protein
LSFILHSQHVIISNIVHSSYCSFFQIFQDNFFSNMMQFFIIQPKRENWSSSDLFLPFSGQDRWVFSKSNTMNNGLQFMDIILLGYIHYTGGIHSDNSSWSYIVQQLYHP